VIKYFVILLFNFSIILAQGNEPSGRDTASTDEILVESNRLKMTNILAPNKIQVLTENVINSLNGSRLSDALELGDALFIKDYGFNSGIKTIALNSTQSEHTLVLIDGIRLNSRQNAQTDLSLYDLDNVERIEISNGGSSALYGSEAIGGVINIITKNYNSSKPLGIRFKSDFGSYGLTRYYGKLSQQFKLNRGRKISYYASYSDERAENNYEFYSHNGTDETLREREHNDYNTQSFNFDFSFTPDKSSSISAMTIYGHFDRGTPGIDIGYATSTARQIDYNSLSSVSYNKTLSGKLSFKTNIDYKYQLQKYFDPATFNLSTVINSFYKLNSYINSTSFNYSPMTAFSLETGYDISYNNIHSNETEVGDLLQGAVFAAGKYEFITKIISKITVYPSIRYDYYSNINQKNVVTGKLGINIKPLSQTDLTFKSSFGNNFGAPTFNELYWKDWGNKDLKPERSVSFDAGVFYRFNFLLQNELEASYYYINTTDRIVWTPVSSSIWRPINIGKVKSEGIDAGLKSKLINATRFNTFLSFNYSLGKATKKNEDFPGDPTYNKQLIYIPEEMVKAALMFNYLPTSKLLKLVSFNVFYRFTTRRYVNFENTDFVPRYDVFDANLGTIFKAFGTDLGFKFIVNNVFNEDYQLVPGYPMPLRNYKLEISFKY
jgi:outer membrane cobalamin receptor